MIIDKINNKVPLDDLVLREEPEVLTRWQDPTIKEYKKEIDRLNNAFDELEKYINNTKLEEFEKVYGKRCGKTFTQAEIIVCNMILNKLNELRNK